MRRYFVAVVAAVAILGLVAPPAMAQAPAPKVTINGLVDFATSIYSNWSGTTATLSPSDKDSDHGWYSRERGVFTFTGEVGKSKGVLSLEFDLTNGVGSVQGGTTTGADLDTDVAGISETKWLYVETPIFGPGSMAPWVPVATTLRLGAQPARGHDYKAGIHLSGDFPGATLETAWGPMAKSTLTFVQMREVLTPLDEAANAAATGDGYAIVASVELQPVKAVTIKPTYSYMNTQGGSGFIFHGTPATSGFSANGIDGVQTRRHTIGGDARFMLGPVSIQPTFYYQWGEQECAAGALAAITTARGMATTCASPTVDIRTWILDVIAGFRTGPLNIEGRAMWTPGNDAGESIQAGDDVNYYRPINPGFIYGAGWTEFWTGGVDYATAVLANAPGMTLRTSPSYDKYGRIFLALAADYSVTPAFTLKGIVNTSFTDEAVDDTSALGTSGLITSPAAGGGPRYLGTETSAGFTYRFAPNVALDTSAGYLFAGDALGTAATPGGATRDPDDAWKLSARVRFTF